MEAIVLGGIMCLLGCWFLREPKQPKEFSSYDIAQALARKAAKREQR